MSHDMSATHLVGAGAGTAFEPQRKNNFVVLLSGLEGADLIELSVKSFKFPSEKTEILPIHYLNRIIKFAGKTSFDDVSLVCHDYVDRAIGSAIKGWRYSVFNKENGKVGYASAYKKEGSCKLIGPDGSAEREYKMIGVWPSALDLGEGDMDAGTETVMITATLTMDWFESP